jgi:hypothetical protein
MLSGKLPWPWSACVWPQTPRALRSSDVCTCCRRPAAESGRAGALAQPFARLRFCAGCGRVTVPEDWRNAARRSVPDAKSSPQVARGDPSGADGERPQGPYGLRPLAQARLAYLEAPPPTRAQRSTRPLHVAGRPSSSSSASQPRGNQSPTGGPIWLRPTNSNRLPVCRLERSVSRGGRSLGALEPAPNGASILAAAAAPTVLRAPAPDPMAGVPRPRSKLPATASGGRNLQDPDPVRKTAPCPARTAQMMEAIGVPLATAFAPQALDRIASRTEHRGRRRAVRDAAPEAVQHLSHRFDVDPRARQKRPASWKPRGARISEREAVGAHPCPDLTRAFPADLRCLQLG